MHICLCIFDRLSYTWKTLTIDEAGELKTYFLFRLTKQNEQRNYEKLVGGEATRHTASCWQHIQIPSAFYLWTYDPFKKHFANGNDKKQLTRSRTKHCNKNMTIYFMWVTGAKTTWISLNCHLMLKTHISRLMRVVPNAALGSSQNTTFLLHLFMKLRLLIIY